MRRTSLLLLLVLLLFLIPFPGVSAEQHIGSTPVKMIPVGVYSREAEWGTTTVFEYGFLNGDNGSTYFVNSSASSDRTEFAVTVFPTNLTLAPQSFLQVYVNVTASGGTGHVRATVSLRVNVSGPSYGETTFVAMLGAVPKTTALDVTTSFIAIGFIIIVGFSASWVFERTGVPDILFLILLGLMLGPVAAQYFGVVLVSPRVLTLVTPYVAALALVMILFDGGLNLNLNRVLRRIGISTLHTVVTFLLSVILVALVTHLVFGYPMIVGILLGVILGGTSGAVVITLVRKMSIHEDSKTILTLESVITDVLCVIIALSIIEFLSSGPEASLTSILPKLVAGFSIAIVVALVLGVMWLRLLTRLSGKPFAYMITIAMVLVLYAAVELVGGSGATAALVFGLVLGNHEEISRMLKVKSGLKMDEIIRQFQTELTFVVRAFFFVFLGLVFTINIGGSWAVNTSIPVLSVFNGTFLLFILGVVLIFLGFVAVRFVTASMTCRLHAESRGDRGAVWAMMGRGLAAAVLASVPFTVSAYTSPAEPFYPYYRGLLSPYQPQFLNIAFLIILLTVVATTVGIAVQRRRAGQEPPTGDEELGGLSGTETFKD